MIARVEIPRSSNSSSETATLIADYVAFDRQRTARRQYSKAFGGIAVIVLLGAAAGRVPLGEAFIAAGLLATPPILLGIVEAVRWRRLVRQLDGIRTEIREASKS